MTGNAAFPTPTPTPDTLNGAFDEYGALLNKGRGCTPVETATKQQLRAYITTALQGWGAYVQENGNNNRTILLTSGFDLSKDRTPVGPLPAPAELTVVKGLVSGSLNAKVKPVPGSRGYFFEIKSASKEDDNWQPSFSTKSNFVFTDLTPGSQYLLRVCAKGSNPVCAYTEPVAVWAA